MTNYGKKKKKKTPIMLWYFLWDLLCGYEEINTQPTGKTNQNTSNNELGLMLIVALN